MKRYILVPVTTENQAEADKPETSTIRLDDEYISEQAEENFWNTAIDKYHKSIYVDAYRQCAEDIRDLIAAPSLPTFDQEMHDILEKIVKKTELDYNQELQQASEFNNNTPGVGQGSIQYASASPLPEWFAQAKQIIQNKPK